MFGGETVPARKKVVSQFEPHTNIIVKGGRGTHYGHKVNFATGRSGLALDAVVEDGNPADSARCLPMLARHVEHYGAAPTHAAFDGGYASRENLKAAKALGVTHAVFHKKRSMKVTDMTPSAWPYRQLKQLPRRSRGGHPVPEAVLRTRPVPLARLAALQGLRAVGAQPDAARSATTATGLTPSSGHRRGDTQSSILKLRYDLIRMASMVSGLLSGFRPTGGYPIRRRGRLTLLPVSLISSAPLRCHICLSQNIGNQT